MQSLMSRGAPHGDRSISIIEANNYFAYSNLIRYSSHSKFPSHPSLPLSRLKVCGSLKLIPNVVKNRLNSLIPHKIRLLVNVITTFGLLGVVLELIHKLLTWEWDFLNVNDLIQTERKGWFGGITIKIKNGDRVFISNGKTNGMITKFDHQMKNGVEMDDAKRIQEEISKIFEEDKDLEQEDSYALIHDATVLIELSVLLYQDDTHEDYFIIRV
ncbi:hypothetical protein MKW92_008448, partial [Papaver armeniacum]